MLSDITPIIVRAASVSSRANIGQCRSGLVSGNPTFTTTDSPGQRRHTKRLMACTILLRNVGHLDNTQRHSEEEFFIETSAATLLRLTESALAIGGDLPYLAVQFLLWLYRIQPYPMMRAFTA